MKSIQKFIVAAALVATLSIGAASIANNNASQQTKEQASSLVLARKVNEYEGQHKPLFVLTTRKVNEYEGQHRPAHFQVTRKVNEYEGQH